MTDKVDRRLSAALRAQASGLGTGSAAGSVPDDRRTPPVAADDEPGQTRLPAWVVLTMAMVLGAVAGALAGAISAW